MRNFKDFIYDISDLILGFFVIVAILILFFLNLNSFFIDTFHQNIGSSISIISSKSLKESHIILPPDSSAKAGDRLQDSANTVPSTDNKGGSIATDNQAKKSDTSPDITITIPADSSSSDIADILYQNDIITSKQELLEYISKNNIEKSLKSGTFTFNKSMTIKQIVDTIKM